jgi:hypothetical protein
MSSKLIKELRNCSLLDDQPQHDQPQHDQSQSQLDEFEDDRLEYLQDKCGIFGCIANGEWPTNLDVAHIICLGLVGLQHRSQSINLLTVLYLLIIYLFN